MTSPGAAVTTDGRRVTRSPALLAGLIRLFRTAATISIVVAIGVAAWYLAPPSVGGSTSLAIVDGTSMLPKLHRDDLVLVRPAARYRVGDVVAYRSTLLHRVVLHRIVAIDGSRYTFKGDNNNYLDPERPLPAQLIGRKWLTLPKAGSLASAIRTPWLAAALAMILVIGWGLGGRTAETTTPQHG